MNTSVQNPKQHQPTRHIAAEICHSELHLAVSTDYEPGRFTVQCRSVVWRKEAASLLAETGKQELIAVLKAILAEWGITGGTMSLSLNGDFCVTRVVVGTNEFVEGETANVESRSKLYLALGHGRKVTARSVRKIDGRHQHALLSVVNARTLDVLSEIADGVGVNLDIVEPSLVSLARLQKFQPDAAGPVIILNAGRGNEVGIVEGGFLYLDYRPPNKETESEIAEIVGGHLHRLQRYYDRYIRLGRGKLSGGYLCGIPERVSGVQTAFHKQGQLKLNMLHELVEHMPCTLETPPEPQQCAALGLLARRMVVDTLTADETPNLIRHLQQAKRQAVVPRMVRTLWPVAAVLLLAFGIEFVNVIQRWRASSLEAQAVIAEESQKKLAVIDVDLARYKNKLLYLEQIEKRISRKPWNEFATHIGQCLPSDAWLDALNIDKTGKVAISGGSFSQDGVFEFVKWLNELPDVRQVSLTGTEAKRMAAGPATGFEVSCEVAN